MNAPKGKTEEQVRALQSALKQKEQALAQVRQSLGGSVKYLSTAAEGQDSKLDQIIEELRGQLRRGAIPSPVLVNQLDLSARAMTAIRRSRAEKQLQGFTDGIAQLLQLNPPLEIKKQLAEFVRNARKVIANPVEQELLPIKFSRIQGAVLADYKTQNGVSDNSSTSNVQTGDTQDPDGSAETSEAIDIEALFADDSLDGLPAYTNVAETIESILTDMLVQIRPPAAAEKALNKAQQILSAGLNWYELAALLEQLSIVFIAVLDSDQHEFELFLQALNERLSGVGEGITGLDNVTQELMAGGDAFDVALRQDIQLFAGDVGNASSLMALQESVADHLESVFLQLDRYKEERGEQQRDYEAELKSLHAQVESMEQEAERAQAEIEAQQKRSERDGLTELPNRDAYERRLGIEMERARRYGRRFCLVVADVDYFKSINDRYGHLAGDKVLKVLAKTIRQRLRRADFIARYGGEEFVIILPETDAEQALSVMGDICSQIRSCPFHFKSEPLKITVSFGIAEVSESDDQETLFARADNAMYEAKKLGRDRCQLAQNVA